MIQAIVYGVEWLKEHGIINFWEVAWYFSAAVNNEKWVGKYMNNLENFLNETCFLKCRKRGQTERYVNISSTSPFTILMEVHWECLRGSETMRGGGLKSMTLLLREMWEMIERKAYHISLFHFDTYALSM